MKRVGPKDRVATLTAKLTELRAVLKTFREGVLLLDEVDMVLHPLKSELNFPIGEKFVLDGAEKGERFSLPIHLIDAVFFAETGRATTFEAGGAAGDILARLQTAIADGYTARALQRLPHFTLLDVGFYNARLKPILAEWAYLWLQKNHVNFDKADAIAYLLEGAIALSDLQVKVNLVDVAVAKLDVVLGDKPASPRLTDGHLKAIAGGGAVVAVGGAVGGAIEAVDGAIEAVGGAVGEAFGDDDLPPPPRPSLVRQRSYDPATDALTVDGLKRERAALIAARDAAEFQRKVAPPPPNRSYEVAEICARPPWKKAIIKHDHVPPQLL